MKDDREALLTQVKTNILVIEKEHKILSKQNKKIKNRTHQMNAKSRLDECSQKIEELKILILRQEEKLEQDEVEFEFNEDEIEDIPEEKKFVLDAKTKQFLKNEDENFKEGVQTTKEILKDMKLANMKLDHISMLVFEQRNKLKNINGEIKKSQSLMSQTKKIMKTFSAELVKDKFIKILLVAITVVLLFIMVCAIKYKMKSKELIGKEIDVTAAEVDYNEINEELFWNAEIKVVVKNKSKVLKTPEVKDNQDLMNFDFTDGGGNLLN
jgi:hypothetical protein